MAPKWKVYNQFVIQYKYINAHTNQYQSKHTNTYHKTYNNIGLQVGINTHCVLIDNTVNTYQDTCPYLYWGRNHCAELKFNTCHCIVVQCIPNTCQYILIHTIIHTRCIPVLDLFSTLVFAQHTRLGMYWHVLCWLCNGNTAATGSWCKVIRSKAVAIALLQHVLINCACCSEHQLAYFMQSKKVVGLV